MRTFKIYSLSNFQICNTWSLITAAHYIPRDYYLITGSLYILTNFTHFTQPFPFTTCLWQPPICSLYVWVVCVRVYLGYTCKIIQHLSFSVWFISFSIMPTRSNHVVSNGKISISFNGWIIFHCIYICVCVYHMCLL